MVRVTKVDFDVQFIRMSVERDLKRSPCIHLSTILRDRKQTLGIAKKFAPQSPAQQHLTFQSGFLWERLVHEYCDSDEGKAADWDAFVTRHLDQITQDAVDQKPDYIVRPGEQMLDGIAMTPDAVNYRLGAIEEWKATAIRPNNLDIENKKPEWLWSTMGYCKAMNLQRGIIRVWHYGQYPQAVSQFVYDWEQDEIDRNWGQVLEHWEYMQRRDKKSA